MSFMNDDSLKREEMKIKQNLPKLASDSTSAVCSKIYKKPSSVMVLETQCEEPCSASSSSRSSSTTSRTSGHSHLSQFFSFLRKPARQPGNTERKNSKDCTPFINADSTVTMNRPNPPVLQRFLRPQNTGTSSSKRLSQQPRSIPVFGDMEKLPSQYKYSRKSVSHYPMYGNSATMKMLNELYLKSLEKGKCERSTSLPYIKPEEALRCRYLRLSESNISDLLQRCKDSGFNVDIHPHMKDSDIDVTTVMTSENINTTSL